MTKQNLKPCPFCGGKAGFVGNYEKGINVICTDCFGEMNCCEKDKQSAAEAWNTRTPYENELTGKIGKLEAENKRLREALERIVSGHPACFEDADCPHKGGAGYDQGCLSCPWAIAEEVLRERGK